MTAATQRRLWLTAGWLTIGYVVLTFAGTAFQSQPTLGDKPGKIAAALVDSSMTKQFTGGYIEFLASLVFLAAALLVARLLRGGDDTTQWLSSCVAGGAVVYTAVMLATGGAAGAAALYDGHHGVPLSTIATVNDIRSIGFSLTGGVAGLIALAASVSGQITRRLPRWLTNAGYVVGVVCIAAVPAAKTGAPQTLLWFAWLVALGVVLLRRSRSVAELAVQSAVAVPA